MLLLIDNYDSFTYNIVHAFELLKVSVHVVRNQCTLLEIESLNPKYIVIGPGPGNPSQAGISKECIRQLGQRIPMLGICLGHQAIGEVFGAIVRKADRIMHGKTSHIYHNNQGVFKTLPQGFLATRYHSLIVDEYSLPNCLMQTAQTDCNEIMGLRHKDFPIEGIQFHPESIATESGLKLFENFLKLFA